MKRSKFDSIIFAAGKLPYYSLGMA